MTQNYNNTQVGVPYVRNHRVDIRYPEGATINTPPWAVIYQSEAVKLADGSIGKLRDLETLQRSFDLVNDGNDLIPMIHPDTGEPLGAGPMTTALASMVQSGHVSLNLVMLALLAVVRQEQTREL
jgi:hypothetical protein